MSVQAAPIMFTSMQFETVAVAIAEGTADAPAPGLSPPSTTPLITEAVVVGTTDFAAASGIANPGLLNTSAEVSSVADFANAAGTSHFVGTFGGNGPLILHLGFGSNTFAQGATGGGSLFVLLTNSLGGTLFDDVFLASEAITLTFNVPLGGITTLDLLLASEAFALTGGAAQNLAQVTVDGTIPVPATLLLILVALGPLAAGIGRKRSHAAV